MSFEMYNRGLYLIPHNLRSQNSRNGIHLLKKEKQKNRMQGGTAKCFENQMLAYGRGAQCAGRIRMEARSFA